MDEIWRDIPNTNGKYQASNYGRIKSFARTNEHIMNPSKDKRGYLTFFSKKSPTSKVGG